MSIFLKTKSKFSLTISKKFKNQYFVILEEKEMQFYLPKKSAQQKIIFLKSFFKVYFSDKQMEIKD